MFIYVGTSNCAHIYARRKEIASLRGRDTPSSAAIARSGNVVVFEDKTSEIRYSDSQFIHHHSFCLLIFSRLNNS